MSVDLIFRDAVPAGPTWVLTFGASGGDINAVIDVKLNAPRLDIPALVDGVTLSRYSGMPWKAATPAVVPAATPWTTQLRRNRSVVVPWQDATPAKRDVAAVWGQGELQQHTTALPWKAGTTLTKRTAAPWRQGFFVDAYGGGGWREAIRVYRLADLPWREGRPLARTVTSLVHRFKPAHGHKSFPWGAPTRLWPRFRTPWQDGTDLTSYGIPWPPAEVPIPPGHVCYTPSPNLVFKKPPVTNNLLLFVCEHDDGPPAVIVVPVQKVYIVENAINLVRVSDGREIRCEAMTLNIDYSAWTWSFSANVEPDQLQYLRRAAYGDPPVELEATINGYSVRVVADVFDQTRTHPSGTLKVSGRGISAVLGAPYAPVLPFDQPSSMTANQLADRVLTFNGASLGWATDWQMVDWLIPANTWSYQGTYADALNSIAAAAGGYIQPDPVDQTLRFLKKYPVLPWEWATVTPDIELPSDIVEVEAIKWQDRPMYNMVHVLGQTNGVRVDAKRAGTAGDLVAPMVVDPLITHVDAGRGRAESILGALGAAAPINLKTLILPEVGLILPGTFVRYVDGPTTRMSLARGLSVTATHEESWQTVEVETNGD